MRRLYLAAFAAALLFTLVMAWLPSPPPVPWQEQDKFWHVFAFVALSTLASLAFPAVRPARIGERLSFLGALIELEQNVPSLHRDCDIRDWIADTAAIAVTLALVAGIRRMRARRPPRQSARLRASGRAIRRNSARPLNRPSFTPRSCAPAGRRG